MKLHLLSESSLTCKFDRAIFAFLAKIAHSFSLVLNHSSFYFDRAIFAFHAKIAHSFLNFSFSLLARNITNGNTSSLRLYENGEGKDSKAVRYDSYCQTNEELAIMKWMQRNYKDSNGVMFTTADNPWETAVQQHKAFAIHIYFQVYCQYYHIL